MTAGSLNGFHESVLSVLPWIHHMVWVVWIRNTLDERAASVISITESYGADCSCRNFMSRIHTIC